MAVARFEDLTPDIHDSRSEEEQETHTVLVGGVDKCLSGWGEAEGRRSVAFWACRPEDQEQVKTWVEGRSDIEGGAYFQRRSDLIHVYAVTVVHPALREAN